MVLPRFRLLAPKTAALVQVGALVAIGSPGASTACGTTAPRMPPTGSISEPSQDRIRWKRSDARTKASSGPATVGPDTTKIAPIISAVPAVSSGPCRGVEAICRTGAVRSAV